jgi:hypothetical protein
MADIGGEAALRRTLQDFYKQEISALPTRRLRRAVRRLCKEYLISPAGRRLSIETHEIHRRLKLPEEILRKLVDRRLLRADQRADSTYYELSHDTLVEPILATSRVWDILLGILNMVGGVIMLAIAFLLLSGAASGVIAFMIGIYKETEVGLVTVSIVAVVLTVMAAVWIYDGILWLRRGVRTARRYLSHKLRYSSLRASPI